MAPTTVFCPKSHCPASGQRGQGHRGIQARKAPRFICHECDQTCRATKGAVFDRLRTSAATVVVVVTLLAQGCPVQALGAAWGFAARPVAAWGARVGRPGQGVQESLVEPPRDLGQVQADERRVKKPGGMVWRAMALMVQTRLGRGRQGAARPASEPAAAPAGPPWCCAPSAVGVSRWLEVLHPSRARALARADTHRPGRTPPAASMAPGLERARRQTVRAAARRRHRAPPG